MWTKTRGEETKNGIAPAHTSALENVTTITAPNTYGMYSDWDSKNK
jgi:hypothetical protein